MVDFGNLVANKTDTTKFSKSLVGVFCCFNIPKAHQLKKVDMLFKSYSNTELIPPLTRGSCGAGT